MKPRSRQAPACCLALALAAGAASAQTAPADGGPLIVGEKKLNYKNFELVRLDASLELLGQWRQDRLKETGQPTQTEKETLLRQTIDLGGEAYIGHKNLIDLSGNVKLGLDEDSLDSGSGRASYVSITDLYSIRALVLGASAVPTTVYTSRDENILHQDFGGSLNNTVTETGAIANFRSSLAPTSLQLFHRDQEQTDQRGNSNYKVTQDTAILHSEVKLTATQRLLVDYDFDRVDTGGASAGSQTYDRHQGSVTHWATFGALGHDSLRSSLYMDDQTGTLSQRTIRLDEELVIHLTKHLESRYYLTLEELERNGQNQRVAHGTALLRHRLFESLTSTLSTGGSTVDIPGYFTSNEVFLTGTLDYTKKIPYGTLNATASASMTRQENGARGSAVGVANSAFVFNDPFPVIISRRNIVPSSIVVMDTARIRVYMNGIDYTVQAFPDRVELTRVVGGAIANGQAVLIDFDIGPEPANSIDSNTEGFSLRYSVTDGLFSGLSVYGVYRQLDQSIDAVDPSLFVLDSFKDLRYGAEYRIGGATFIAEEENHNSTVSSFDSNRLEARFDRRFSRSSTLTLSISRNQIDYRDTGQSLEFYLVNSRWTQKLLAERGEDLDFSVHLQGRQENHSDSPTVHGVEGGLDFSWHKRQTTIYASIFASVLDTGPSNSLSESISIGLKRAF